MGRTLSSGAGSGKPQDCFGLDSDRHERLLGALRESALDGAAKSIAGELTLTANTVYHQVDGQLGTCFHKVMLWLDGALRGKGQTPDGRQKALAPLHLLNELYLIEAGVQANQGAVNAALGRLLLNVGRVTSVTSEAAADGSFTPPEQQAILRALVPLVAEIPALAGLIGITVPPSAAATDGTDDRVTVS